MEDLITKKARAKKIITILKKEYTGIKTALRYSNPLELLVATILSAQCTDIRVNQVTEKLFRKYRNAHDYASAESETLEKDIFSTGFYKEKAKKIKACCSQIEKQFNNKMPETLEELVTLNGVGRKTVNPNFPSP